MFGVVVAGSGSVADENESGRDGRGGEEVEEGGVGLEEGSCGALRPGHRGHRKSSILIAASPISAPRVGSRSERNELNDVAVVAVVAVAVK